MGGKLFRLFLLRELLDGGLQLPLKFQQASIRIFNVHPKNARRRMVRKKSNAFRAQRQRRSGRADGTGGFAQSSDFGSRNIAEKFQGQMKLLQRTTRGGNNGCNSFCKRHSSARIFSGMAIARNSRSWSMTRQRVFWQYGQKKVLRAACVMRTILVPHLKHGFPARS
jgi:hypothetical protein